MEIDKVLGSKTFGIVWLQKKQRTGELRAVWLIFRNTGTGDVGGFACLFLVFLTYKSLTSVI